MDASAKTDALRSYGLDMPKRLSRAYGIPEYYSPFQVERILDDWAMHSDFESYAYSIAVDPDAFAQLFRDAVPGSGFSTQREEILSEVLSLEPSASTRDVVERSYRIHSPTMSEAIAGSRVSIAALCLLAIAGVVALIWLYPVS